MNTLHIVADSSMDMPADWQKEYEIEILPINIQFGEKSYQQGVNLDHHQFYRMVRELKMIPKTSLPSPAQIADYYRSIARRGESILSMHVASKMSGTYQAVLLAAKDLVSEFDLHPFDSGNGSAGLAYMCKEARLLQRAGHSLDDILRRMEFIRRKVTIVLTLDNLEFARMSGRVSMITQKLSSLLQVKPVILLKDGMLDIADRVRTRNRSIERVIELVKQKVGKKLVNIAIVHAEDLTVAAEMLNKVRDAFRINELITTDLSISVAANLGPGTVGIIAYPVMEGEE